MESPIPLPRSYAISPARKQDLLSKVCHTHVHSEEEAEPHKIGTWPGKSLLVVVAKVRLTISAGLSPENGVNSKISIIFQGGAPPFCSLEVLSNWQKSISESQRIRSFPSYSLCLSTLPPPPSPETPGTKVDYNSRRAARPRLLWAPRVAATERLGGR